MEIDRVTSTERMQVQPYMHLHIIPIWEKNLRP